MEFVTNFRTLSYVNYIGVDDFSDRLSYQISSSILTVLGILVTARTYAMMPIACYIPQGFGFEKGGQLDFVDQYCLTEGTYAVDVRHFHLHSERNDGGLSAYAEHKIYYYQWVPLVLGFQAVLCCLPRLVWRMVSFDRAGTDVGRIVKLAKDASEDSSGGLTRRRMVTHIARLIERMIKRRLPPKKEESGQLDARARLIVAWRTFSRMKPSQLSGNYLIITYLLIKFAYLLNAVGQLLTMKEFLQLNSTRYTMPGIDLLREVLADIDWQNTMVFPRVGACAVKMRSAVGVNWLYAQCALPVNMINEKIYVFLWFWFFVVAVVTIVSAFGWLYRLAWRFSLINFVKDYLRLADNYSELKSKKHLMHKFVKRYLSRDGAFLMKMIALNCGDMVCADVVNAMWESFLLREKLGDASNSTELPGLLALNCRGLPASNCVNRRRKMLRWQKSAPESNQPPADLDELAEHAAELEQCRKEGREIDP
ncbi:hypothetical protein BOX15_Mlig015876g2 [Macrostomum lignano]|uniref:Innexin n=1 Tax=Macrostomum lignano TaxID=282301 RepID=A0A267EKW2_9PLAT|nr:hypothetical protein BOX15_Mlig015876g2 [Macrostomum lignano]